MSNSLSQITAADFRRLNSPATAIRYLVVGLTWLTQPGLRRYVWIPLVINLILYSLGLWLGIRYFSAFLNWMLPGWLDFMRWLLWPVFAIGFFTVMYFTFSVLANIIGSPFYGVLAERTAELATGRRMERTETPGRTAMLDGLRSEWRRLAYLGLRVVPLAIVFLIPVVNLAAPILWMVFNAWFMALEYTAYPLEARGCDFDRQRELLGRFRIGAATFGGTVMLAQTIPLLNVFAAPAAVIGATLYLLELPVED
ncbi:sulfate transporter CysZ [Methylococcus geothermalis]|uniref:Sulfate transporter CysZ n=1 Tax=Methylococcus geothermalis TaxID=2681310 RepID=A0A858Q9B9_9GAMM|nr:sulfate transporter CysZ [Methylococcus geothermalis]QJD30365.1 sulfate transporter CysZ [Methylococcus geothermalis]